MPPLTIGKSSISATGLPTRGWSVVWIAFATILPWTVVAVFDAIDSLYRRIHVVVLRLLLSTGCNLVAYCVGIWFVVELVAVADLRNEENGCSTDSSKCDFDRFDEIATFLVLLFFNIWFVLRNIRGWTQLFSLYRLRPLFITMQIAFADATAEPITISPSIKRSPIQGKRRGRKEFAQIEEDGAIKEKPCVDRIALIRVSDRLINNDIETRTPLLNPLSPDGTDWAIAAWRAWWTQDCSAAISLEAASTYDVRISATRAQDLPKEGPRWPRDGSIVTNPIDGTIIKLNDVDTWLSALSCYGSEEGQQDTRGPPQKDLFSASDRSGVATLVYEITSITPHRMTSLWYATARFEELYKEMAAEAGARRAGLHLPACFSIWKELASDVAQHLDEPMYLSGDRLCCYAGELASTALLLTRHAHEYRALVERVFNDGRAARWTFGWSGLLSCFSNLWTRQRVFIAMLNGLSLLAIHSASSVGEIEPCVRAMLVGYASFAVSDRAVGKRVANARKAELLRRYRESRGKSCRGTGLCATRDACEILGIPAEASHMDGLPAFSTGWTMEYLTAEPGSQPSIYGGSHTEIEEQQGSSNAWRYPDSKV